MRKKPVVAFIEDNVYRQPVLVVAGTDDPQIISRAAARLYPGLNPKVRIRIPFQDLPPDFFRSRTAQAFFDECYIGVWFRDRRPPPSVIAHEALHIVTHRFQRSGIPFTAENQEVIAYYLEWLVEAIIRDLN